MELSGPDFVVLHVQSRTALDTLLDWHLLLKQLGVLTILWRNAVPLFMHWRPHRRLAGAKPIRWVQSRHSWSVKFNCLTVFSWLTC